MASVSCGPLNLLKGQSAFLHGSLSSVADTNHSVYRTREPVSTSASLETFSYAICNIPYTRNKTGDESFFVGDLVV
jgi:hypothetical protein